MSGVIVGLDSVRIESPDPRGWHRNRGTITSSHGSEHRLVRLRRDDSIASGVRALEGVFTCDIPGDSNTSTPVSVGIYYPSESHVQSLIITTFVMLYPFILNIILFL